MKLRRPKRLFFQVFGMLLVTGSILLGCFQVQWIRIARRAEEARILQDIRRSADHAADEAFDEIRALLSFAYISPEHLEAERRGDLTGSLDLWESQSKFPALLENILVLPTHADEFFLRYNRETGGFEEVDPPEEFLAFQETLAAENAVEAYHRAYPRLLQNGYFILPLFQGDPGNKPGAAMPVSDRLLAIEMDVELFYAQILPAYLDAHLDRYTYRIAGRDKLYFSSVSGSEGDRPPDVVVPVFGDFFMVTNGKPQGDRRSDDDEAAERAMRNPVSRFWFLRTSGFPAFNGFTPQEIRSAMPVLEIFYPDRTLESAMRNRTLSSLLLGIGTLIVLLASYFVLYALLVRTDKLRSRERDFVTSMSHELRTPLSVISATSDNLSRGIVDNPEKVKTYGGLIQAQSQRLGKMVESILFYSGLETRVADSMSREPVYLESFFAHIIENLKPAAEQAGAHIRLLYETRIRAVWSDPDALRVIAENLIVNAIRHGVLGADGDEVRVILRTRVPRLLYLVVEDDGEGIPPAELKLVFEPFTRGERSKAKQVPGSGLGLDIVRRVCTKLGGQLSVLSPYPEMAGVLKQGARFTAKIPVRYEGERDE